MSESAASRWSRPPASRGAPPDARVAPYRPNNRAARPPASGFGSSVRHETAPSAAPAYPGPLRPDFAAFQAWRATARTSHPSVADAGETNLYRVLARHAPHLVPAIAPSNDPSAGHRCHLAEQFLAAVGLDPTDTALRARCAVATGVRHTLRVLMAACAQDGRTIALPDDVYPAYHAIAQDTGVRTTTYSARAGVPIDRLDEASVWLVCDPLKPWGGSLSEERRAAVRAWVAQAPADRLVVVDAAYATLDPAWSAGRGAPPVSDGPNSSGAAPSENTTTANTTTAAVRRDGIEPDGSWRSAWAHDGTALVCWSLSKGWSLPDVAGCAVLPPAWVDRLRPLFAALPKDDDRLARAFAALTAHADRPRRIRAQIADWTRVWRTGAAGKWADRHGAAVAGYFAVVPASAADAWERRFLALPASVFCTPPSPPAIDAVPRARDAVVVSLLPSA